LRLDREGKRRRGREEKEGMDRRNRRREGYWKEATPDVSELGGTY